MEESTAPNNQRSRLQLGSLAEPEGGFGAVRQFDAKCCPSAVTHAVASTIETVSTEVFIDAKALACIGHRSYLAKSRTSHESRTTIQKSEKAGALAKMPGPCLPR